MVDQDGVDYVDLVSSWGANLLGYGHPRIARADSAQIARLAGVRSSMRSCQESCGCMMVHCA